MASIHSYQTKKGNRRYVVRYRGGGGRQRSRAFSTLKDAHAFKLGLERERLAARGRLRSDKFERRRLFDGGEIRQWLRSRQGAEG